MSIHVRCPNRSCRHVYVLRDEAAGKTMNCKLCNTPIHVPGGPAATPEAAKDKPASPLAVPPRVRAQAHEFPWKLVGLVVGGLAVVVIGIVVAIRFLSPAPPPETAASGSRRLSPEEEAAPASRPAETPPPVGPVMQERTTETLYQEALRLFQQAVNRQIQWPLRMPRRAPDADWEENLAGRRALVAGKYREAVGFLSRQTSDPVVALEHAVAVACNGDPAQARSLLEAYVAKHPASAAGYAELGAVHHQMGQLREAVAAYEKALSLQPDLPEVAVYVKSARAALAGAGPIEANPHDPRERLQAARQLTAAWKTAEALVHLERAAELLAARGSARGEVACELALALLRVGRTDEAIAQLEGVGKDEPERAWARYLLAAARLHSLPEETAKIWRAHATGDANRRDDLLARARQVGLRPRLVTAHFLFAMIGCGELYRQHPGGSAWDPLPDQIDPEAYAACLAELREHRRWHPDDPYGHWAVGKLLRRSGRPEDAEEAIRSLSEALRLRPDLVDARRELATALLAAGQAQSALEHFRRLVSLSTYSDRKERPSLYRYDSQGLAQAEQRWQLEQAAQLLAEGLELDARHVPTLILLGRTQARLGDREKAFRSLRAAVGADNASAAAWLALGEGLLEADQLDEAEKALARADELAPGSSPAKAALGALWWRRAQAAGAGTAQAEAAAGRAVTLLTEAIALDPKNEPAYLTLGAVYRQRRRKPELAGLLQKATAALPDSVPILELAGQVQLEGQMWYDALMAYESLSQHDPFNGRYHLALARIHLARKQYVAARDRAQRAQDLGESAEDLLKQIQQEAPAGQPRTTGTPAKPSRGR